MSIIVSFQTTKFNLAVSMTLWRLLNVRNHWTCLFYCHISLTLNNASNLKLCFFFIKENYARKLIRDGFLAFRKGSVQRTQVEQHIHERPWAQLANQFIVAISTFPEHGFRLYNNFESNLTSLSDRFRAPSKFAEVKRNMKSNASGTNTHSILSVWISRT